LIFSTLGVAAVIGGVVAAWHMGGFGLMGSKQPDILLVMLPICALMGLERLGACRRTTSSFIKRRRSRLLTARQDNPQHSV